MGEWASLVDSLNLVILSGPSSLHFSPLFVDLRTFRLPILHFQSSHHSDLQLVAHQNITHHGQIQSKLKLLVPTIGTFFTKLPLAEAFKYQDKQRFISSRRFVPPSFNDVRLILNTAQLLGLTSGGHLDLATFDGDVTL